MAIDPSAIFNALESHALSLGLFADVRGHEPMSAPAFGERMTLSFWSGPITPVLSSGLASVSMRWELNGRIYKADQTQPREDIDPEVISATLKFFASLTGDFELGGLIRYVDVFGSDGQGMGGEPGWYEQDDVKFRTMDITIPLLINDELDLVP